MHHKVRCLFADTKLRVFFAMAVGGWLLSACSSLPKGEVPASAGPGTAAGVVGAAGSGITSASPGTQVPGSTAPDQAASESDGKATIESPEVSSEVVEENAQQPYKSSYGEIDLDYNTHVEQWIQYFQGRGRKYMELYLSRSARYLPMMKNTLRENGLPENLVYVALIESGFSPQIRSRSNAVGYWQFMRSTGRRFGLTVNPFIDERRDPVLSTRAAAEYFKQLYSLFGSWHLALAAYNVGENRVRHAVTRYYTRNFWDLIRKRRSLPAETKQYIPKFIAATLIAKDPDHYGFKGITYEDPLTYDTVVLQRSISLTKLATNLSVDVEELKLLNPKFRSDFVPLENGTETGLRIPVGRGTDALAALSLSVTSQPKIVANAEVNFYRIRRGDSLSTIAHHHHTTVSMLRRLNRLSNRTLLRVGMRIRVPDVGVDTVRNVTEEDALTGHVTPVNVDEGVGRPTIATKESVTAASGSADGAGSGANAAAAAGSASTSGSASGPGPSGGGVVAAAAAATTVTASASPTGAEYHIVRRGENLSIIAHRYRVSIEDLKRLNNLSSRTLIRKGQRLRVRPESPRKSASPASRSKRAVIVVRRGETLYHISKRYGVPVRRLARVNGLSINHQLVAGKKLTIPH